MSRFSRGDCVIYTEIQPSRPADPQNPTTTDTTDLVEHYLTVRESSKRGTLVLVSQNGQMHVTHTDNPSVRRAPLWVRLFCRSRFPRLDGSTGRVIGRPSVGIPAK